MTATSGWICTRGHQSAHNIPDPEGEPLCIECRRPAEGHRLEPKMYPDHAGRYRRKVRRMSAEALVVERRKVTGSSAMSDRDLHKAAILESAYVEWFGPGVHHWQVPAWP